MYNDPTGGNVPSTYDLPSSSSTLAPLPIRSVSPCGGGGGALTVGGYGAGPANDLTMDNGGGGLNALLSGTNFWFVALFFLALLVFSYEHKK